MKGQEVGERPLSVAPEHREGQSPTCRKQRNPGLSQGQTMPCRHCSLLLCPLSPHTEPIPEASLRKAKGAKSQSNLLSGTCSHLRPSDWDGRSRQMG